MYWYQFADFHKQFQFQFQFNFKTLIFHLIFNSKLCVCVGGGGRGICAILPFILTSAYYHLPMNLWEGNVFSHVCPSVCSGVPMWLSSVMPLVSHRSHGPPPPQTSSNVQTQKFQVLTKFLLGGGGGGGYSWQPKTQSPKSWPNFHGRGVTLLWRLMNRKAVSTKQHKRGEGDEPDEILEFGSSQQTSKRALLFRGWESQWHDHIKMLHDWNKHSIVLFVRDVKSNIIV